MTPHWMRDNELAQHLGISRAMVHKMRAQGMPSIRIGRARRFDPEAVTEWLTSHSQPQSAA